jgi:hypothetical protein
MLNARTASLDPRAVKALAFAAGMLTLTWLVAGWVIESSSPYLALWVTLGHLAGRVI